jgi:hypothetical protein
MLRMPLWKVYNLALCWSDGMGLTRITCHLTLFDADYLPSDSFPRNRYKESANCRREVSYAHDLDKPIIPIIVDGDYFPGAHWGWLGLIIAGDLEDNHMHT